MNVSTLTRKGQVTIPGKIRKLLGLRTGDKVEFIIEENNRVVLRPVIKRVKEVYGKLEGKGKRKFLLEEIKKQMKERLKEKWNQDSERMTDESP